MSTLALTVANDIANALLKHFARGKVLQQTTQDKPLLAFLSAGKKEFPGGASYVSDPVQGAFLSDQGNVALNGGNFFQGYQEDDSLSFGQAANILRAEAKWYEVHAGLVITWTELKKDGITITDGGGKSEHSDIALDRLTSLMENRLDDYAESWSRAMNTMLWNNGAQDSKQIPGITALLPETTDTGTTMGLSRVTYPWWRHRAALGIVASAGNQTLSKRLRSEQRPLRRFGGQPNKFLCGSAFLDGLELEIAEKGIYTQEGFARGATDVGIADISLRGVGKFEYDPTLDDFGLAKYCFEIDSRRIRLRPMQKEWNKVVTPERPYQYMVFLKSMTSTGALQATQLNCHEVFSIA
jgi:hypothetical protein